MCRCSNQSQKCSGSDVPPDPELYVDALARIPGPITVTGVRGRCRSPSSHSDAQDDERENGTPGGDTNPETPPTGVRWHWFSGLEGEP